MTIPELGFGTAPIMGRLSRRKGLAALERSYAAGIRHYDTARSYGWGEAEGVVGSFLGHHAREEIRLVTKCGILPVRHSPALGLAKSLARTALKLAPGLKDRVRRAASAPAFQPVHTYDLATLAASLRTSLGELRLAHIDVLLLHNFEPGKPGLEDVVGWFKTIRRDGVIRRFGFSIEGDLEKGLDYLARKDLLADAVVQTPVSESLLALPGEWRDVPVFAHSPFSFLKKQAETGGRNRTLADLLRALAETSRCEVLLCSMFDPAHLRANVAAWQDCRGSPSR